MTPPVTPAPVTTCPQCGQSASGRFCANCGATLGAATCAECDATLTPGARFCHRCGTPAGAAASGRRPATQGSAGAMPWAVAAIALLALVAMVAGRNFGAARGGTLDAPRNALPNPALDGGGGDGAQVRAPDISSMSPRDRADKLYDRLMRLQSEGKTDSVQFFAPMAVQAYQMLGPLDTDARYDLGRIGAVTGLVELAKAESDTILRQQPNHLLGLILGAQSAAMLGDSALERDFEKRIVAAAPAESKKALPEYQRHRAEIENSIAEARRSPTS